MSNNTDPKIKEIENRLSCATPGEWNLEGKEIWRRGKSYGSDLEKHHLWITDFNGFNKYNAALIANAPADIAYLLSEIKRLTDALEQIDGVTISQFASLEDMVKGIKVIARTALSHLKG